MTRAGRSLSAALALLSLSGCGFAGHINLEPVAVSTQKPSNVALFVAVSQHGSGLVGLDKQAFRVFENGVLLDSDQIKLALLPTSSTAARHTALLVDMSKTLTADDKKALTLALRRFIVKLRQREAVSLYAFDGTEKAHFIFDYTRDARAEPDEKDTSMDRLLAFSRRDSSSSLYSAVIDGAQKLSVALAAEGRAIQSGTLIVIALNPDLAGRIDEGKVRSFVAASPHHYFMMTVGPWATSSDVSFVGKNGSQRAGSVNTMSSPLETVASQVDDDYFRNYLVSYCSPSRAGTRELRLEVTTTDDQGKKSIGSYQTEFDSSGFGPGCDSAALPHFETPKTTKDPDPRVAATRSASSAAPKPSPANSGTPIAEPPSGLGYE